MNSWTMPSFFPNPCVPKPLPSYASQPAVSDLPTIRRTFLLSTIESCTQPFSFILLVTSLRLNLISPFVIQRLNFPGYLVELKWIRLAIDFGHPQDLGNSAVNSTFTMNSRSLGYRARPGAPGPTQLSSPVPGVGLTSHIQDHWV